MRYAEDEHQQHSLLALVVRSRGRSTAWCIAQQALGPTQRNASMPGVFELGFAAPLFMSGFKPGL